VRPFLKTNKNEKRLEGGSSGKALAQQTEDPGFKPSTAEKNLKLLLLNEPFKRLKYKLEIERKYLLLVFSGKLNFQNSTVKHEYFKSQWANGCTDISPQAMYRHHAGTQKRCSTPLVIRKMQIKTTMKAKSCGLCL
jgi:hypothetical protein